MFNLLIHNKKPHFSASDAINRGSCLLMLMDAWFNFRTGFFQLSSILAASNAKLTAFRNIWDAI